jgi:hypothetical protein
MPTSRVSEDPPSNIHPGQIGGVSELLARARILNP